LFWDAKHAEFLEKENAELKLTVKKLMDSIIQLKGGLPVFTERKAPRVAPTRASLRDIQARLEQAEAGKPIRIERPNG
jgi:hypothetical protein